MSQATNMQPQMGSYNSQGYSNMGPGQGMQGKGGGGMQSNMYAPNANPGHQQSNIPYMTNPVNNRQQGSFSAWRPPADQGQGPDIQRIMSGMQDLRGYNSGPQGAKGTGRPQFAMPQPGGGMSPELLQAMRGATNSGVVGPGRNTPSPMNPYGNTNPYTPGGVTDQVNAMQAAQRPGFNPLRNEGYR